MLVNRNNDKLSIYKNINSSCLYIYLSNLCNNIHEYVYLKKKTLANYNHVSDIVVAAIKTCFSHTTLTKFNPKIKTQFIDLGTIGSFYYNRFYTQKNQYFSYISRCFFTRQFFLLKNIKRI